MSVSPSLRRVEGMLTIQEAQFANMLFSGERDIDAFLKVFPEKGDLKENSLYVAAKRLREKKEVKSYLKLLSNEVVKRSAMCFDVKRDILASLAMDSEVAPRDRISAIKVDNDMVGDNAAKRAEVTHDVGGNMLDLIKKIRDGRGIEKVERAYDAYDVPSMVIDESVLRIEGKHSDG